MYIYHNINIYHTWIYCIKCEQAIFCLLEFTSPHVCIPSGQAPDHGCKTIAKTKTENLSELLCIFSTINNTKT